MPHSDAWKDTSLGERNEYTKPQTSRKQFAPEPQTPGAPDPAKRAFQARPRRSQDMNVPLYQEQNTKGLEDFLESVMSDPRPGPGDNYRSPDGKLRFRVQVKGQAWLIEADDWDGVLRQLDAIEGAR